MPQRIRARRVCFCNACGGTSGELVDPSTISRHRARFGQLPQQEIDELLRGGNHGDSEDEVVEPYVPDDIRAALALLDEDTLSEDTDGGEFDADSDEHAEPPSYVQELRQHIEGKIFITGFHWLLPRTHHCHDMLTGKNR